MAVFKYRFLRQDDDDEPSFGSGSNRKSFMEEEDKVAKKERTKVVETEDASRGPLSGCIRLADSSRIIQRLKVGLKFRDKLVYDIYIYINICNQRKWQAKF